MLLTPLIAILGARTPGATAWPWFVVIPLVVILQWPSLSQLAANQQSTAVEIPTPTIIGFFFILVMGAGNYFGTALTFAGLIGSTAVVVFLLPVTEWMQPDNAVAFPCGCLLLGWAAVLVTGHMKRLVPRTSAKSDDVDGLWRAFCDIYGMVWTKRVMDRVNQFAERESWDVRLSLDGFVSWPQNHDEKSFTVQPIAQAARRRIQILAWVLKRFVDEPFLRRFVSSDIPLDQAPG